MVAGNLQRKMFTIASLDDTGIFADRILFTKEVGIYTAVFRKHG